MITSYVFQASFLIFSSSLHLYCSPVLFLIRPPIFSISHLASLVPCCSPSLLPPTAYSLKLSETLSIKDDQDQVFLWPFQWEILLSDEWYSRGQSNVGGTFLKQVDLGYTRLGEWASQQALFLYGSCIRVLALNAFLTSLKDRLWPGIIRWTNPFLTKLLLVMAFITVTESKLLCVSYL